MTESPSATTFVVGDRLPWPDDPSASAEKGPLDPAQIFVCGSSEPCSIRKISALGVTISSKLTPALGERVSIELPTGQRPTGKISWTGSGELGVRFDDHIDVVALLNRKLVSLTPERRTMPRIELRCPVYVKCGENLSLATLRNISAGGLQLEGEDLPPTGTYVSVIVQDLNVPPGEIIWRRDRLAGVEVLEELSWTSIIPWVRQLIRDGGN